MHSLRSVSGGNFVGVLALRCCHQHASHAQLLQLRWTIGTHNSRHSTGLVPPLSHEQPPRQHWDLPPEKRRCPGQKRSCTDIPRARAPGPALPRLPPLRLAATGKCHLNTTRCATRPHFRTAFIHSSCLAVVEGNANSSGCHARTTQCATATTPKIEQ